MNKQTMALLEKAFAAEIDFYLNQSLLPLIQTKSKLAKQLAEEGLLQLVDEVLPGKFPVRVTGYMLTELGRFEYCTNLPPLSDEEIEEMEAGMKGH